MIKFKVITIEGFCSIQGPFEYKFDRSGINRISGPNGSGKTTIFSAMSWCLFGKTLKGDTEVEPWEWTRTSSYDGTYVSLSWDYKGTVYRVRRTRTKLEFSGTQQKHKNEIQKEIEKSIGYSFTLFRNTILFGQGLSRIINEPNSEKKKIFEEAFEVSFIQDALQKAHQEKEAYKTSLSAGMAKRLVLTESKGQYEINLNNLRNSLAKFERLKEAKIKQINSSIKKLKASIIEKDNPEQLEEKRTKLATYRVEAEELVGFMARLEAMEDKAFRLKMELETEKGNVDDITKRIRDLRETYLHTPKKCPTCSQPLNQIRVRTEKQRIMELIAQERAKLKAKAGKVPGIEKELKAITLKIKSRNSKSYRRNTINHQINLLEKEIGGIISRIAQQEGIKLNIARLRKEREKAQAEEFTVDLGKAEKMIRISNQKIRKNEAQIKEIEKRMGLVDWVISDPLSNKGIKAYIFHTMLQKVNKALLKYAKYTGFNIEFNINLDSYHKDFEAHIYKQNHKISYKSLSGGQAQLVNVCIAMAMHDVIASARPCNILIMDEVFESLDDENIGIVSELIIQKSKLVSLHLISHLKTLNLPYSSSISLNLTSKGTKADKS